MKEKPKPKPKGAQKQQLGRPRAYSDEDIGKTLFIMGDQAISLKAACAVVGVSYANVRERINGSDALTALYAQAVEEYARSKVDMMHDVANNTPDVARARLICDNIKWETQRVCRHFYGEKVAHTGENGGPIQHAVTLTSEQARRMAREILESGGEDQ